MSPQTKRAMLGCSLRARIDRDANGVAGPVEGKQMVTTKPKSKMKPKPKDVRDGRGKAPGKFIPGKGRFVRTDDRKAKPQ
jgi:hypothetical protein